MTGRVLAPGDRPVEAAAILVAVVPQEGLSCSVSQVIGRTFSGADGAFRVRGLGEGSVWLRPEVEGFVPEPVEVGVGATGVSLRLRPEVPCEIRVVDPDGAPVARVPVVVRDSERLDIDWEDFWPPPPTTDEDGRMRLRGLARGHSCGLTVRARHVRKDLRDWTRESWIPVDLEIRLERVGD